jgi:murein DD-endopeptidase MepM/ murein hydrolase activator NlpD
MMDTSTKCSLLLLLVAACIMSGCTSPPEQKGIWPWEYSKGKGEPDTGDYFAVRMGVGKFDEPPAPVKLATPETDQQLAPDVLPAPAISLTIADPLADSSKGQGRLPGKAIKDYDFTVSENSSTSISRQLLDMVRSAADITAFNNGNAPVTVAIDIDPSTSYNSATDKTLPHYAVVPANTTRALVHVSAKVKDAAFNFRYNYIWNIGDYTARHNCPEHYRFPFGEKVRAYGRVSDGTDTPSNRYAVTFSMPKGTPVLAARKGTVINISSDSKIDILHEDSTIGTYRHLEKVAKNIVVGKTVTTEDVIGIVGTARNRKDAYLQLSVWRPEPETPDAARTNTQRLGLGAVSFPLAFSSSASDKGSVLTESQPVSRGKLPAGSKQPKRKKTDKGPS